MSKSLPVYELWQWIKSDRNIGYVVARLSAANVWEVRDDYANRKDVERFNGRGAGYVIQWVEINYTDWGKPEMSERPVAIGSTPYRLSWLRAETIAERRYQPCENPVKAPDVPSAPMTQTELEQAICAEDSQPVLPLDIEAATEATMRAAVALGNQAADWLRAKGLTV